LGLEAIPGLIGFNDAPAGSFQILIAADFDMARAMDFNSRIKVRFWPLDDPAGEPVPVKLSEKKLGLSSLVFTERQPQTYWVSLMLAEQSEILFAVNVLKDNLTGLIIHFSGPDRLKVFQFINPLVSSAGQQARVRLVEQLERDYLTGRPDDAREFARSQLDRNDLDPVTGSLGAFLFADGTREDYPPIFERFAQFMIRRFPDVSDSHVIMAESLARRNRNGDKTTRQAYERAIKLGLPFFGPWVDRLREGVRRIGTVTV